MIEHTLGDLLDHDRGHHYAQLWWPYLQSLVSLLASVVGGSGVHPYALAFGLGW